MPFLTNLADVCRTSGLAVVEHDGWATRGYRGWPMRSAKGVLAHWTGAATSPGNPTAGLGVVRDGRSDLPGPLAHIFLDFDATVHVLAAGWCNHAGAGSGQGLAGNPDCIGIECGCGGVFSPAQFNGYPRLLRALRDGYGMQPSRQLSHAEFAGPRKVDINSWPGGMNAFRATVAALTPGAAPITEEVPDMTPEQAQDLKDTLVTAQNAALISSENRNALAAVVARLDQIGDLIRDLTPKG